ncbi:MAG: alpha/beta hydrolase [Clostridia bacterium]|nr:alpha/beta hydrolase [Clostridia bacterium]
MERFDFISHDGKRISVVEWNDVLNPKGVIQISHGMAEHALRYDKIAKYLNGQGFIVFADDHRAHGGTDALTHGYCDGDIFEDTLKDMALLTEHYKNKYGLPIVLFGHSYGSFLSQCYVQRYSALISGAVIGGSSNMGVALPTAGNFVAWLACMFGMAKKPANLIKKITFDVYDKQFDYGTFISSIKEECDIYAADPDCGFVCSYNFYRRFFKGLKTSVKKKSLAALNKDLPLLLIAGKDDPVSEKCKGVDKLEAMYLKLGVSVEKVTYDGVRHEYLNDTSREQAFEKIAEFANRVI